MRPHSGLASLALAIVAAGCGTGSSPETPIAPSPPAFTVTVRSGVDGFPPIAGAEVRAGGARVTTNASGQALVPLAALGLDDIYTVTAQGFVGRESRLGLGTTATLWPLLDGTTTDWVFSYSYTTNGGVEYLKRPAEDIRIEIPSTLQRGLPAWTEAARQLSQASTSGDPSAPTVRLVGGEPGARLMVAAGTPCPREPCLSVAPARLEATDYALEVLAGLMGFDLAGSRRARGLPSNPFVLTATERLAVRMRFLRVPGTIWDVASREVDWQIVGADGEVRYR